MQDPVYAGSTMEESAHQAYHILKSKLISRHISLLCSLKDWGDLYAGYGITVILSGSQRNLIINNFQNFEMKNRITDLFLSLVKTLYFRCVLASIYEGLSVRVTVCPLAFKRNRRKRGFHLARRILLPARACFIMQLSRYFFR